MRSVTPTVQLVDMNTGFAAGMFVSDNLHPSASGYKLMADRAYAASVRCCSSRVGSGRLLYMGTR